MMSIETMLGATVEELRAIADDESLSGAYKDSLYTAADWVVAAIDRITSLEQDNQEQCRLNAMGAEREARLMARVKELEKDCCQLIDDRDERDEVIDALMAQVLGGDCKEWSSAYGFNDAVVDVECRMKELEKDAERYRFASMQDNFCDFVIHAFGCYCDDKESADSVIDTAMQKD